MPDIPRNTKTNAVLDLNTGIQLAGSFSGRLEKVGDHDWVRVELVAGQTYDFYLSVLETGSLVSGDSTLSLRNAGGNEVAFNDDGGGGETPNSVLSYTPTVGGSFFVDIGEYGNNQTGTYSLFVAAAPGTADKFLSVGNDTYTGVNVARILGGHGDDTITIGAARDALGEQGNDIINGNSFFNLISGGLGNDVIDGAGGNDVLLGDAGNDTVSGGSGHDLLRGGTGKDSLTGGADDDIFKFSALADSKRGASRDVITDFSRVDGDTIDLGDIDARTGAGDQAFHLIGTSGFHHVAGELRYAHHLLQGDVNGDGVADFEVHVNAAHLAKGDFVL